MWIFLDLFRDILLSIQKEKIPSPDYWAVESFMDFFEQVGDYLLKFVEEVWLYGRMSNSLNTTFMALIPIVDHSYTFDDFSPIPS